ncbi:hypothetical protein LPLAFNJD_LOCUS1753 [Methylorubrum aminovorans]
MFGPAAAAAAPAPAAAAASVAVVVAGLGSLRRGLVPLSLGADGRLGDLCLGFGSLVAVLGIGSVVVAGLVPVVVAIVLTRAGLALAGGAPAATAAAAAAASAALLGSVGGRALLGGALRLGLGFGRDLGLLGLLGLDDVVLELLGLVDRRDRHRAHARHRALVLHRRLAAFELEGRSRHEPVVGGDGDRHLEALLQVVEMCPLLVEDVERGLSAGAQHDVVARRLEQHLLDRAQNVQRHRGGRPHEARAAAMGAGDGGGFEHAGADALAAHLQEAEGRDPPDLDARPVVLQRLVQALLHRPVVALLLHVDEVDHDEAGQIAQAHLAGDFLRRLEVRLERGVLDVVLAGGAARVHVDRDQRLGRVDDEVAARAERHVG